MFLDAKVNPVAFVPMSAQGMAKLRDTAGLDRMLGALEQANASSAIIAVAGKGLPAARNLGRMLSDANVNVMDILAGGESVTNRGEIVSRSTPFESRGSAESGRNREPVATLTGNELGPWQDMRELGQKVAAWYHANLVGRTVTNKETGWNIGFNATGADKVSGRKGDVLMRLVPALRQIIESGTLVETMRTTAPGRASRRCISLPPR